MSEFKHGLSAEFVDALCALYHQGGWWTKVVDDPEVFITLRNEYVCVYYRGNCLLRLAFHDGHPVGKIHYKYLLNPDLEGAYWDVKDGQVRRPDGIDPLISDFSEFSFIKHASEPYAGEEKYGVSEIIAANPNIIDVEIALGDSGDLTDEDDEPVPAIERFKPPHNPRMDFVAVQDDGKTLRLVFFEAKHFSNKELRSRTGKPPAVNQIELYAKLLKKNEQSIVDGYRRHCADMLKSDCIPKDSRRRPFLGKVRDSAAIELDILPRLVVFGFDADQKPGKAWKLHKDKLEEFLRGRVFLKGDAKDFVRGVRFRGSGQ